MKFSEVAWRGMTAFDLSEVVRIAGTVHPGYFEAPDILAERHALYRNGTFILEIGTRIAGYVLSHPWRFAVVPALNNPLGAIPKDADTYYVHDIAVLPMARRVGAASEIVGGLIKHAEAGGFATASLVAVNHSQGFWERHGFEVRTPAGTSDKLLSYGADARFMARDL